MKYKLSTEKVNEYGFKVLTSGIEIPEDTNIPVLFNHNPDKVLGKWDNFTIENDVLLAEPVLDTDDEEVSKISNKINKGIIDGISIGFKPIEYDLLEDGTVLVTKAVLKEASITALPANTDARIELNENYLVTFSLNGCDINKIKEELSVLHNNKEKLIKEKIEDTKVEPVKEDIKVEPVKEDTKVEPVKEDIKKVDNKRKPRKTKIKKELDEDMVTLADRLIASLNIEVSENDNKYSKVILSINDMLKEKDNLITELTKKVNTFESELSELKNKTKEERINTYLNLSITQNKINKEQYKEFYELALIDFDKVKTLIDKMPVSEIPAIKLTDNIIVNNEKTIDKNYAWYQKHDPSYLKRLRETNLTLYNELKNAYIENLKK